MAEGQIPNLNDSIERANKHLLIDDHASIVKALNRSDLREKNFLAVCCVNVDEAVSAIEQNMPKTLFVDNSLSPGGNEGLEIVKIVKERWPNIKMYSTTNNPSVFSAYEELGVGHVDKDLEEIDALLKD